MVLEATVLQIPPTTGRSKFPGDHMSNDVSQPFHLHFSLSTTLLLTGLLSIEGSSEMLRLVSDMSCELLSLTELRTL